MTMSDDSRTLTLADRLHERIKRDGPISFHDWMQAALYDERDGYYRRGGRIRQGRGGDYRTAPETSSLFGATFANYFMKSYFDLGAPKQWTIVEAGAGRGDFAHACLASLQKQFPDIFAATHYLIDELSDDARTEAKSKLIEFKNHVEFGPLADIREPFVGVIFSNELLDAFPVHRVIGRHDGLRELYVGLNESGEFVWLESDPDPLVAEYCQHIALQLHEGQIHEVNLDAENFIARAAAMIERGLLITVDYGAGRKELLTAPHRFEGTLRAFYKHQIMDDVLAHPSEVDLTTTVDWTQIEEAGGRCGLETLRLQRLDQFMLGEGLLDKLSDATAKMNSTAEIMALQTRARELIMPDGLAAHFQVLVQRKEV
jgi:SAM-dependent MidA family methyltransferase